MAPRFVAFFTMRPTEVVSDWNLDTGEISSGNTNNYIKFKFQHFDF